MTIPLQYDFEVVGFQRVDHALRSVERRVIASNKRMSRSLGVTHRESRKPTHRSDVGRGFAQIAKVAEREEIKRHRQAMRNRQRETQTHLKGIASIGNAARREEMRRHKQAMRDAKAERAARAKWAKATVGTMGKRAASTTRAVGVGAAGLVGIGGGMLFGSQLSQATELERRQRQVAINARGAGEQGVSPETIRQSVKVASIATGASQSDITGGLEAFVQKTGDLDTAMANLKVFSTVAMATGSTVQDVASAAADLSEKFDLRKTEDMASALSGLAFQGKQGAFELRDMASQFPKMGAAAARFGLTGSEGVRELGGFAQMARQATGSGEEAATAVETMFRQLLAKSTDIQSGKVFGGGRGVEVFEGGDPTRSARDARQIVKDVIVRSGGDITQLQDIFDVRGIKAVSSLATAYRTASASAGGGEAGAKAGAEAIDREFKKAIDTVGGYSDIQRDAIDASRSMAAELERLNTVLNDAMTSELLPALRAIIPDLAKIAPHLATLASELAGLVGFFAENPFEGLGILVLGMVAKDLAAAGIGQAVKAILTAAAAGQAATAAGGAASAAGAAGAAGAVGKFLSPTVLGASVGAAGMMGAGALAAGGGAAALYSNAKLKEVTGGDGIGTFIGDLWDTGSFQGAFGRIDERQNEQARAEAMQREGGAGGQVTASMSPEVLEKLNRAAEIQLEAATVNRQSASGGTPNRSTDPTTPRSR